MLPVLRLGGKNNAESLKRPAKGSTVSNDEGLCQFSSCQSMLQSSMHTAQCTVSLTTQIQNLFTTVFFVAFLKLKRKYRPCLFHDSSSFVPIINDLKDIFVEVQ